MKTSTKILTGFFLIVFLVPLLMLMAFKSKIRKGEFSIVKREFGFGGDTRNPVNISSARVVRLAGLPGNNLKVHFEHAAMPHLRYPNGYEDSVRLQTSGDTLSIQYVNPGLTDKDHFRHEFHVYLSLPSVERIFADQAELEINSLDSSGNQTLNVELSGKAVLRIGRPDPEEYGPVEQPESIMKLQQLSIKTQDASAVIGSNVQAGQVHLDVKGHSKIYISDAAVIGDMQGNISDSSSINAAWKYLKRLAPSQN